MPTITLNKPTYDKINNSQANFTINVTLLRQPEGQNGAIEEAFYDNGGLVLLSPIGSGLIHGTPVFINNNNYFYNYSIDCTINNMLPGQVQNVQLQLSVRQRQYQLQETTTYYFYYMPPGGSSWATVEDTNLQNVANIYVNLSNNGYSVLPTQSAFDVISYGGAYLYFSTNSVGNWYDLDDKTVISNSITLYTKTDKFYFGNGQSISAGTKWNVQEGIQTIMPNIYNFNDQATAWKRWKNQSAVTACSAFQAGKLSAAMLNNAYAYLGQSSTYKSKDRISAAMFSGLEKILNE